MTIKEQLLKEIEELKEKVKQLEETEKLAPNIDTEIFVKYLDEGVDIEEYINIYDFLQEEEEPDVYTNISDMITTEDLFELYHEGNIKQVGTSRNSVTNLWWWEGNNLCFTDDINQSPANLIKLATKLEKHFKDKDLPSGWVYDIQQFCHDKYGVIL